MDGIAERVAGGRLLSGLRGSLRRGFFVIRQVK